MMWTKLIDILENRKVQAQRRKLEVEQLLEKLHDDHQKKSDEIHAQQQKIREEQESFWQNRGPDPVTGGRVKQSKAKIIFMIDEKMKLEEERVKILEDIEKANQDLEEVRNQIRKIGQKQEKYRFLHKRHLQEQIIKQEKLEDAEMEEAVSTRIKEVT